MVKREERALTPRTKTFLTETRSTQILDLMVQGLSVAKIADKMGVTEEAITIAITKERQRMSIRRQEMLEGFTDVTNARCEWLLSKIMPVIEYQAETSPEIGPSKELVKMALDIIKVQKDVIVPPKNDKGNQGETKFQINNTFIADSPLYDEALKQMQTNTIGYYEHKSEEPMLITPDQRVLDLESLAAPYYDIGELDSGNDSDSES